MGPERPRSSSRDRRRDGGVGLVDGARRAHVEPAPVEAGAEQPAARGRVEEVGREPHRHPVVEVGEGARLHHAHAGIHEGGDVALGAITTQHYSAAHDSPENKAFVEAFKKANNGMRPNFMAVGGYDGMHLIYEGLKKTNGEGGQPLVDAMKGMSWTSPRGPVTIDAETRDIVQDIYIREVKEVDGELYNVEFDVIEQVKDPVKAGY